MNEYEYEECIIQVEGVEKSLNVVKFNVRTLPTCVKEGFVLSVGIKYIITLYNLSSTNLYYRLLNIARNYKPGYSSQKKGKGSKL